MSNAERISESEREQGRLADELDRERRLRMRHELTLETALRVLESESGTIVDVEARLREILRLVESTRMNDT